jgi:hydrogenase/urease accessory protein HupE
MPAMILILRRLKNDPREQLSHPCLILLSLIAVVASGVFVVLQRALNAGLLKLAFVGTCLLWLLLTAIEFRSALRTK